MKSRREYVRGRAGERLVHGRVAQGRARELQARAANNIAMFSGEFKVRYVKADYLIWFSINAAWHFLKRKLYITI
jgi:hypothetical protein